MLKPTGDSPHDGCQEGECGDRKEAYQVWSQCEPHQQGEWIFISTLEFGRMIAISNRFRDSISPKQTRFICLYRYIAFP